MTTAKPKPKPKVAKTPADIDELIANALDSLTPAAPLAPAGKPSSWWDLRSKALAKDGIDPVHLTPIYTNNALFTALTDAITGQDDTIWAAVLDDITNLYGLETAIRTALDDAWFGR